MDREEERGYYGIRRGFSHNLSLEPTRPAAARRIGDIIVALAGRLISRPLGRIAFGPRNPQIPESEASVMGNEGQHDLA